jgi:hypothetical protein
MRRLEVVKRLEVMEKSEERDDEKLEVVKGQRSKIV